MSELLPAEYVLTCSSWQEAQDIADALFAKSLIACAEFIEIKSRFSFKNGMHNAKEIKLIMISSEDKFDEIEKIVAANHSYDTYVLQALPVVRLSKKALTWLKKEINGKA